MDYWTIADLLTMLLLPVGGVTGAWVGYGVAKDERSVRSNLEYAWYMFVGCMLGVVVGVLVAVGWALMIPLIATFGVLYLIASKLRKRSE